MNQADWVAGRLGPHNTPEAGTKALSGSPAGLPRQLELRRCV